LIIDSHTHILQNWHGNCGHPTKETHKKYLQRLAMHTVAKTARLSDGRPVDASRLLNQEDNTWKGLRDDINFRIARYGRLEYTVDGIDYYTQYMPVNMVEIEAPPELLVAHMESAGVDHCVLQAGMTYGVMNDYNALAQRKYPEKFTGLFHVDEPRANNENWLEEANRCFTGLSLKGLFYQLETFSRYGFESWFDDDKYDCFWEMIESFNIPVFFEPSSIPNYDKSSYINIIKRFDNVISKFPKIRWLLAGCPPVAYFGSTGRWEFPDAVRKVFGKENIQIELCFPIVWGGKWDYPYIEAKNLIEDLFKTYGSGKLIWGSDMPNVERYCTYRQCIDYVYKYCDFFSANDIDAVFYKNIKELCNITAV
jgi:predicted TIM-barrel fold metal-dependent hydrolase